MTNGLPIATVLSTRPNITLHLVGGLMRGRTLASVGPWAERVLSELHADILFLGANGITPDRGVTTPDLAEASIKRAFVRAARRVVVLADHSKVGRSDLAKVVDLDDVDLLLTDDALDPDLRAELTDAGLTVELA